MRPTSKLREVCGRKSSIRQIFAVVPPMSNDSTSSQAALRGRDARGEDRAAGRPDSTRRIGKRAPSRAWSAPPPDSHQVERAGEAVAFEPRRASRLEIARHQRLHVGVARRRSRSARTRASPAQTSRRQRDRTVRAARVGEDVAHAPLVVGIGVSCAASRSRRSRPAARCSSRHQRRAPPPRRAAAARRPCASMRSGTVKRRSRGTSGAGLSMKMSYCGEAVLVAHLERVAKALGGDAARCARPCARSARWSRASCRG